MNATSSLRDSEDFFILEIVQLFYAIDRQEDNCQNYELIDWPRLNLISFGPDFEENAY